LRVRRADWSAAEIASEPASDLQWFKDAKLGIFIHWASTPRERAANRGHFTTGSFRTTNISRRRKRSRPQTITRGMGPPFKTAGARYAVLTSKHHDGFALWDTKLSPWNAKDASPAGRDLIGPYCAALRHEGLKVGLYFSHLDWAHPDYPTILPPGASEKRDADPKYKNIYSYPQGAENPEAWKRFLTFHRGQLRELGERFHPDLFWFDGDWERSPSSGV